MTAIALEALGKSFVGSESPAVAGIDLEIADGEFVVLLGPSGCGKSTTLRLLAGLETPTSGILRFDGVPVNDVPGRDRNVGMVFQNYALYPHMTVEDNLSFGLRSRGADKETTRQRVKEILGLLDLSELARRRPRELSGGQRQRVALGRALVGRPSVFLMDEPLSNLDANLREQMRMEIARLHRKLGITTVYVTHDQVEALTLADRIVVMDRGAIQQVATPRELYARPANVFVARFIGAPGMNVLRLGRSLWEGPHPVVQVGASVARGLSRYGGDDAVIGVRPEDLRDDDGSLDLSMKCDVVLVEQLGTHLQVHLSVYGLPEESLVVAKLAPNSDVSVGDRVQLGARAETIHHFDAATSEHRGRAREHVDLRSDDFALLGGLASGGSGSEA